MNEIERDFADIYRLSGTETIELAPEGEFGWMKRGTRVLIKDTERFENRGGFTHGTIETGPPRHESDIMMVTVESGFHVAVLPRALSPLRLAKGTVVEGNHKDYPKGQAIVTEVRKHSGVQHLTVRYPGFRNFNTLHPERLDPVLNKERYSVEARNDVRRTMNGGMMIHRTDLEPGTPVAFSSILPISPINPPCPQGVISAIIQERELYLVDFPGRPGNGQLLDEKWFDYELVPLAPRQCDEVVLEMALERGFKVF